MTALTIRPIPPTCPDRASLLSIPPEVRNQIYRLLFTPPIYITPSPIHLKSRAAASLEGFGRSNTTYFRCRTPVEKAALTRSCRQLHDETQLMYLNTTPFHLIGLVADPVAFANLTSHLPIGHRQAIRHIVLTAKIAHLRCLNETWDSLPFGHAEFFLETLTIIPRRPELTGSAFAEVADLSQCHTLAYILSETLKGLRNVGTVIVRNEGCFNDVIWRLLYRSLVFRLWKWCGRLCDLRFCDDEDSKVFEIRCARRSDAQRLAEDDKQVWSDVLQELKRLIGADSIPPGLVDML